MPLICSEQWIEQDVPEWFKQDDSKLNIVETYNLAYNAVIMDKEGLGYVFSYDKLTYDKELHFCTSISETIFKYENYLAKTSNFNTYCKTSA